MGFTYSIKYIYSRKCAEINLPASWLTQQSVEGEGGNTGNAGPGFVEKVHTCIVEAVSGREPPFTVTTCLTTEAI